MITKYPSSNEFLQATAYSKLVKAVVNIPEKELICSTSPKLHEIEYAYGTETIESLIGAYILNFQKLLNIKEENKLDSYQISMLTLDILSRCRGLTYLELVMMFKRFLSGEFGHFYGQIDIMVLGQWMREFMKKRGEIICTNPEVKRFILERDQNYIEK